MWERKQATQDHEDANMELLMRMRSDVKNSVPMFRHEHKVCKACGREILGRDLTVRGESYHPEHFQCSVCHKALATDQHYFADGACFCPDCWGARSAKCAGCGQPILSGSFVTALGSKWHEEHFCCAACGAVLRGSYSICEGKPYCQGHAPGAGTSDTCARCGQPIVQGMKYNNKDGTKHWHAACFVCATCKQPFPGGVHYEVDGEVYCQAHLPAQASTLCAGCGKPVVGNALEACGRIWHIEHFCCALCGCALEGKVYRPTTDNRAVCAECAARCAQ